MWRYCYTITRNVFRILEAVKTMDDMIEKTEKYPDEITEEYKYGYVRYITDIMKKTGRLTVDVSGQENLPKEGGYMMYPNHQGKWDFYSLISVHKEPLSFVMDIKKSNRIFIKQIVDVLRGKRLDKQSDRQAITVINEVAKEVEQGRRYVLFPEGMFDKAKKNNLYEFKPGCFKISLKSKTPIIPVALIDSYKPYNSMITGLITTGVHFLKPIFYEEYKDMNTREIAELVKTRIAEKIEEETSKST